MKQLDCSEFVDSEIPIIFDDCVTSNDINNDSMYFIIVRVNPIWKQEEVTRIILDFYSDLVPNYNVSIWQCFSLTEEKLIKKNILEKINSPISYWNPLVGMEKGTIDF